MTLPSLYLCRGEDVASDLVGVIQHILGTLDTAALGLDKTTLGSLKLPEDMVGQAIRLDEFS